jgi:hypothetical protein
LTVLDSGELVFADPPCQSRIQDDLVRLPDDKSLALSRIDNDNLFASSRFDLFFQ